MEGRTFEMRLVDIVDDVCVYVCVSVYRMFGVVEWYKESLDRF